MAAGEVVGTKDLWDTESSLVESSQQQPAAKKLEDNTVSITHVGELVRKYKVFAGEALPEDLRVTETVTESPRN